MKTFRLLIVALLLAGSASAQRYERKAMRGEYSPYGLPDLGAGGGHHLQLRALCDAAGGGAQPHGHGQRHAGLHRDPPSGLPAGRETAVRLRHEEQPFLLLAGRFRQPPRRV